MKKKEIIFSVSMVKETYILTDTIARALLYSTQNQQRQPTCKYPEVLKVLLQTAAGRTSQLSEEFRKSSTVGQAKQGVITFTCHHVWMYCKTKCLFSTVEKHFLEKRTSKMKQWSKIFCQTGKTPCWLHLLLLQLLFTLFTASELKTF